jgi:hypothetical protein
MPFESPYKFNVLVENQGTLADPKTVTPTLKQWWRKETADEIAEENEADPFKRPNVEYPALAKFYDVFLGFIPFVNFARGFAGNNHAGAGS